MGGFVDGGVSPRPSAILTGLRVVEACKGGIAGPLVGMFFADLGAEVVKVEPPAGDPDRDRPGFAMWNRGKRSLVVDSGTESGRRAMQSLWAGADVVIVDSTSSSRRLAGIGRDEISRRHPSLVYLEVPPYLGTCPWAGAAASNPLLSAYLGSSLGQSSFDGGPVDPVYPHFLYVQGVWAACAAVAALVERSSSGEGQIVTVGGVHGVMIAMPLRLAIDPSSAPANRAVGPGGPSPLYSRYRCSDGKWIFVGALTPKFKQTSLEVLGLARLLSRPDVQGNVDALTRPEKRAELRASIADAMARRSSAEWLEDLLAADCPAALVEDRESWLDHPQVRALDMSVTLEDPERGPVTMPGNPLFLQAAPKLSPAPAPALGELAEPPNWPEVPGRRQRAAPSPNGPLHGHRVLDLGMVLAGPYAGTLLAELGADVVKVEIPSGDSFRDQGFTYIRGQRGLALDLRSDRGREIFHRLVESADVVIDNYRPGVLERLGADYETLRKVKPDIISISISAFGESGPLKERPGFDPVLQAMSGMMAAQGGDSEPVLLTLAVNDVACGALTALCAGLALLHRKATGQGQRGQLALASVATFMQSEELVRMRGRVPPPVGGRDFRGPSATDRFYRARDGWLRVAATTRASQDGLREVIGSTDEQEMEVFFATRDRHDAIDALSSAGVPVVPARYVNDLPDDPDLVGSEVFHQLPTGAGHTVHVTGRLARFSRTESRACLVPPGVGEHSSEVLRSVGLGDDEIDDLYASGVSRQGSAMRVRSIAPYR